jgi:hypothetical protein
MSKFASGGQVGIFNADGSQVSFPILDGYAASDTDESDGTYNYYGFLKADGSWYIMQTTKTQTAIRYFAGTSDYTTSWTGKAGLSYGYFNL